MTASTATPSGWRRFWNNGGWWKALALAVGYWVVYQGIGMLLNLVLGTFKTSGGLFASAQNLLIGQVLPVLLAGGVMLLVAWSFGWLKELFARQPIGGRWWMWIAVIVVLGFNAVRYATVDYAAFGLDVVLLTLFLGVCVGFTEELVCRGFAVQLLRRRGYGEWAVAALSSALFAMLHAGNYIGTTALLPLVVVVVYAFFFGVLMYLTMRVTGSIVWAMVLHATTDPSVLLLTGAIDTQGQAGSPGPLLDVANLANPAVILVGIVLLIFIRGRVGRAHYGLPESKASGPAASVA
ncbi:hypothetical protein GCM10022200_01780 [Microbacterium awajiense]|uniref:CAAX prenyl protease 2/Lysostaphin resistance protein A-like domain-containing protein n=2 Tax=Microbacterium awajiense TaxID=415214 RepID=A0ABP7A1Q6_9MICO